jgi:hypothetical protein
MPDKHPATQRIGGPGASHEDRKHPDKIRHGAPRKETDAHSDVSGGGGENDAHHTHDPELKGKGRHKAETGKLSH